MNIKHAVRALTVLAAVVLAGWGWMRYHGSGPVPGGASAAAEESYTCPMHPTVRSDRPGACPVCQMTLVKKAAPPPSGGATASAEAVTYACPMHPEVTSDRPADCPQCGMELEPAETGRAADEGISRLKEVSLSPTQRLMANVSTCEAAHRVIERSIQASGIVSYPEPGYSVISLRFSGRIEKLFVTYAGQTVRKGDPVAEVYSPEILVEEQAYLRALDSYRQSTQRGGEVTDPVRNFLRQARQKLVQFGFTDAQLEKLGESETLSPFVTVTSHVSGTVVKKNADVGRMYRDPGEPLFEVADLSRVWIILDVYEQDVRFVNAGQEVELRSGSYPDETFRGRVTFLDPIVSPDTRTVRVRTECPNPAGRLRPNMYVTGTIRVPDAKALAVPSSAVMASGARSFVWVEAKENCFVPRPVTAGAAGGGYTAILSGLKEGEHVVTTGGFLIDSESALSWAGESAHQN
jgi:membrane fusion protein, copper/silver efflux system